MMYPPHPYIGHSGASSQNPNFFMHPTNPNMWFRPPPIGTTNHVESPNDVSQMPQFSTQGGLDTIVLEEEEDPPTPTMEKNRIGFTMEEDILLIQSWLNVSKDAIVGVDQTAEGFWSRIKENYNNYRGKYPERRFNALKSRWFRLNGAVQKFVGCYKDVAREKRSGHSENDIMIEALAMYAQDNKNQKFKFEHAWRLLKDEPKWKGEAMPSYSRRSGGSTTGAHTPSSNPGTPIDSSEYDSAQPSARPMGQKAAKRKARSKEGESSSTNVNLSAMETYLKEKNALIAQVAEAKKRETNAQFYEILMKDTSDMSEEQKANHNLYCDYIKRQLY